MSERCVHCGADLFAPPPRFAATRAALFYLLFGGWLLLVFIQRAVKPARLGPWFDYLVFIGAGIAVVFQIWMRRKAASEKRSETTGGEDPGTASTQTTILTPAAATRAARLHSFLGSGFALVAALFLVLTALGVAPILPPDSTSPQIAYALLGIVAVLVAVALLVFKPRVPRQGPEQSAEEYWSMPEIGTNVFLVWFLLEGAGTMATVAYLLIGGPVSAFAMGLAIVPFWLCGPKRFAKK